MLAIAIGLELVAARLGPADALPDLLQLRPLVKAMREPWTIVVGPVVLVLGAIFLQSAYLNLFTGINYADGQAFYLARSIRYLQDGNLSTYSTVNDFLPHLHQTISAYLLLFFGSDMAILLLTVLFGGFVCLTLFDLSRLTNVPVSLSLLAGLSPLCATIVSLHLSTTNFDVHTALLILLAIYFLVLFLRTALQRNLLLAACATSLALSIKPTFWFAAPGLLILWLAALVVVARMKGVRALARVVALAGLIVVVGGIYILRNVWTHGFLITPSSMGYGLAAPTVREIFDLLFFNVVASTTTLLTPNLFLTPERRLEIINIFRIVNESVGITLPNERIFAHIDRSWSHVFDHFETPFNSDKAGFGTIVPLLIAPSAIFVVADALRRRTLFTIPGYLLLFAALYLATLALSLTYSADHVRYLIEMVIPLLVLVPVLIARLPVVPGLIYLAVAASLMVTDAYQAYWQNDQRPPDRVMSTPRDDQYATFVAPDRFPYYDGARLLDRKYPVDQWPELFLLKPSLDAVVIEYPFLGPSGRRRLTYWVGDLGQPRPSWPGPLLVLDPRLAEQLGTRFADQIVLDRLSSSVWVGLPLDRLRVLWQVDQSDGLAPPIVRIGARVAPGQYRRPEFRFMAIRPEGGDTPRLIRDFSADPTLMLQWSDIVPVLDLQVEVREAGSDRVQERVLVPQRIMYLP
jgi:hypothetical protein